MGEKMELSWSADQPACNEFVLKHIKQWQKIIAQILILPAKLVGVDGKNRAIPGLVGQESDQAATPGLLIK